MNKKSFIILTVFVVLIIGYVMARLNNFNFVSLFFRPRTTSISNLVPQRNSAENQTDSTSLSEQSAMETVATDIQIPWEIVFLPDQSLLVTERTGQVLHITPISREKIVVDGVRHIGEGGLLGMAIHPDFPTNHWIYLYHTTGEGQKLTNRVERYTFDEKNHTLNDRKIILDTIPAAANHDGGRIVFGPDKFLYITTGDAGQQNLAQDTKSLAGKILRITDEGQIPSDNPFGNAVYSYGHRNPQGLAWDSKGQLWSTEHGPSGSQTGNDEVNRIVKGGNYGWPTIKGDQTREGMIPPVIQSGSNDTWAPADLSIVGDTVLFTGLRGESLYTAQIMSDNSLQNFQTLFQKEFGRLRVVREGPDGWLYLATSNTDGRGIKKSGDDQILRFKLN